MPRSSKSQSKPEPTGPRLVRKSTPRRPAEPLQTLEVTHEQVALRAYELFVQGGREHGHHLDHWLRAERELIKDVAAPPAARAAGTRARR